MRVVETVGENNMTWPHIASQNNKALWVDAHTSRNGMLLSRGALREADTDAIRHGDYVKAILRCHPGLTSRKREGRSGPGGDRPRELHSLGSVPSTQHSSVG